MLVVVVGIVILNVAVVVVSVAAVYDVDIVLFFFKCFSCFLYCICSSRCSFWLVLERCTTRR